MHMHVNMDHVKQSTRFITWRREGGRTINVLRGQIFDASVECVLSVRVWQTCGRSSMRLWIYKHVHVERVYYL